MSEDRDNGRAFCGAAPLLSIAIPTYNRSSRLRECLNMLTERISELNYKASHIEIVVVDNASTDETAEVVKSFYLKFERLVYAKNDRNLGIDGNIHRCSQLATGVFVQLLSDDDVLLPGALLHLLEQIDRYSSADFLFLNPVTFVDSLPSDKELKPEIFINSDIVCVDQNQVIATCGIWLTFLSSFVFRRSAWNRSDSLEKYLGTDIYLSYALFDLLSKAAISIIVARPLIAARAHFSGSYRIFYAFGFQWAALLLERAPSLGFDFATMKRTLHRSIRQDLLRRVIGYRCDKSELTKEEIRYIFHGVRGLSPVSFLLWLSVKFPRRLLISLVVSIKYLRNLYR
ncbi:MAG TPA: glycosyltransferase family 2 protein [Nitrosomonas sp.]|jgi:glycosyltransferase involved in cell wall biosynthesis|nr:glycosyltransferase family 2 protein [Nitrosomonas sp.]